MSKSSETIQMNKNFLWQKPALGHFQEEIQLRLKVEL